MQDQEDALAFVRGECSSLTNEDDRGLLEGLKEAWSDPKKSKDEKWLIDFFVNERCVCCMVGCNNFFVSFCMDMEHKSCFVMLLFSLNLPLQLASVSSILGRSGGNEVPQID